MTNKFVDFIASQDIYGHKIEVNYKGDNTYRTKLGAFFTLAVFGMIVFNATTLFLSFSDGSNQTYSTQTI